MKKHIMNHRRVKAGLKHFQTQNNTADSVYTTIYQENAFQASVLRSTGSLFHRRYSSRSRAPLTGAAPQPAQRRKSSSLHSFLP